MFLFRNFMITFLFAETRIRDTWRFDIQILLMQMFCEYLKFVNYPVLQILANIYIFYVSL